MTESAEKVFSLSGVWQVLADDGIVHSMRIPGTLEENNIGHPDRGDEDPDKTKSGSKPVSDVDRFLRNENMLSAEEPEIEEGSPVWTRFTRSYVYEGPVRISRMIEFTEERERRYFFRVERSRQIRLLIDNVEIPPFSQPTLVTGTVFEVTGKLNGSHMLTVICDNRYEGLPKEEILRSNLASDNTATNWNGLLGAVEILQERPAFVFKFTVTERENGLKVTADIRSDRKLDRIIEISSLSLGEPYRREITIYPGQNPFEADDLVLKENVTRWDEKAGKLYPFTVSLLEPGAEMVRASKKTVMAGVRRIEAKTDGLYLNGRRLLVRGETNYGMHPETGYCPMDRSVWKRQFELYRDYGLNFVFFRTHCPPDAAFEAADETGILVMAELSRSRKSKPAVDLSSRLHYENELQGILSEYANHPSFIGLSMGGIASDTEEGKALTDDLLRLAKKLDPSRLFIAGPNVISENNDLLLASDADALLGDPEKKPSQPVLSYGACDFEMLPDFREIDLFSGFLKPEQLKGTREVMSMQGHFARWAKYAECSGETAFSRYRDEIRRFYLNDKTAGFVFLSLQDMIGDNGRPRGMMFSYPVPKPYEYASPRRMQKLMQDVLPMIETDRFSFGTSEQCTAPVILVNFGKTGIESPLRFTVKDRYTGTDYSDCVSFVPEKECYLYATALPGERKKVGTVTIDFKSSAVPKDEPSILEFTVSLGRTEAESVYTIYLYPEVLPICPETVFETKVLNEHAIRHLQIGGRVFLTPTVAPLSRGRNWFVKQDHPLLYKLFLSPSDDGRWRALEGALGYELPDSVPPLITILRHPFDGGFLSPLFEAHVLNGEILVSSLGLKENLKHRGVRALLESVYSYLDSDDCTPTAHLSVQELQAILKTLQ